MAGVGHEAYELERKLGLYWQTLLLPLSSKGME